MDRLLGPPPLGQISKLLKDLGQGISPARSAMAGLLQPKQPARTVGKTLTALTDWIKPQVVPNFDPALVRGVTSNLGTLVSQGLADEDLRNSLVANTLEEQFGVIPTYQRSIEIVGTPKDVLPQGVWVGHNRRRRKHTELVEFYTNAVAQLQLPPGTTLTKHLKKLLQDMQALQSASWYQPLLELPTHQSAVDPLRAWNAWEVYAETPATQRPAATAWSHETVDFAQFESEFSADYAERAAVRRDAHARFLTLHLNMPTVETGRTACGEPPLQHVRGLGMSRVSVDGNEIAIRPLRPLRDCAEGIEPLYPSRYVRSPGLSPELLRGSYGIVSARSLYGILSETVRAACNPPEEPVVLTLPDNEPRKRVVR